MKSTKCAPAWNAAFALRVSAKFKLATASNAMLSKSPSLRSWLDPKAVSMSLRLQRVREMLKRELGEVIRREIPVSQAGLITVNDVNVSRESENRRRSYIGMLGRAYQKKRAWKS